MKAYDYLYAAHLAWTNKPVQDSLLSPTLFLLCHAVELTLKGNLLLCGETEAHIRAYGHKILELWDAPLNSDLRLAAESIEQDISSSAGGVVDRTVRRLAPLHWSRGGKIALRYETDPNSFAPVPNVTIPVFVKLARIGILQTIENLKSLEDQGPELESFASKLDLSYFTNWNPLR